MIVILFKVYIFCYGPAL